MKNALLSLFVLVLTANFVYSQYSYNFYTSYVIEEPYGVSHTPYYHVFEVNTQILVSNGQMQANGNDIRFVEGCNTSAFLDYYIESGMNTSKTKIHVKVPSLGANQKDTITMLYGDPAASAASNFSNTFPNARISNGSNVTLTGTANVGWLEIHSGDKLIIGNNNPLTVIATHVSIAGTVDGNDKGYQSGTTTHSVGGGPGGGTPSNGSSGSGGGSYGGKGGKGGYDSGDTPGNGGSTYGSATTIAIRRGSSGSTAASSTRGGAGGGAISIYSDYINISGTINMNGQGGITAAGQCPGGGAGGGILLVGDSILGSGTLNAKGGAGKTGTSTANDGGGGGGGGRIKIFSDRYTSTFTTSVAGGAGGGYGDAAHGTAGAAGSTHLTGNFSYPTVSSLTLSSSNTPIDLYGPDTANCGPFVLRPTIGLGSPTFNWSTGAQSDTLLVTNTNTFFVTVTAKFGCATTTATAHDTITVTIDTIPKLSISLVDRVCIDTGIISLAASPSAGSFTGAGVSGNSFDPLVAQRGTHVINYKYTDGNGCSNNLNDTITVDTLPVVSLNVPYNFCLNSAPISFTNYSPIGTGGTFAGNGIIGGNNYQGQMAGLDTIRYSFVDAHGCRAEAIDVIRVDTVTKTSLSSLPKFCESNTRYTLIEGTPAGGVYTGPNVINGGLNLGVGGSSKLKYTYTNAYGCQDSSVTTVTVDTLPIVTHGSLPAYCSSETAVSLSGGQPTGGVYSGQNVSGATYNPSTAGAGNFLIWYKFTDGNGCADSARVTVQVIESPEAIYGTADTVCYFEGTISLSGGMPAGGDYKGDFVSNGMFDVTSAGTGDHTVRYVVGAANGCSDSTSQVIRIEALPTSTLPAKDSVCTRVLLTLDPQSGSGMDYLWSTQQIDPTIDVGSAGTYWVKITDPSTQNNCFITDTIEVSTAATCVGLEDVSSANELKLYPNPSHGAFSILNANQSVSIAVVRIFNQAGQLVFQDEFNHTDAASVNLNGVPSGMYHLHVTMSDETTARLKVQVMQP